eukprot:gene23464-17290_t
MQEAGEEQTKAVDPPDQLLSHLDRQKDIQEMQERQKQRQKQRQIFLEELLNDLELEKDMHEMEERQKLRGQEKLQKEGVRVELHDYGQVHQFSRELGWKTERQQLEQQCRQQEIPELFEQLKVIDQKLRELLQQEQQLVMQEAGEEQRKAETTIEQIWNLLNCRMEMLEMQKQQYEQRVHEAGEVQT